MNPFKHFFRDDRFDMNWQRLFAQGLTIILLGFGLVFVSVVKSDVIILYGNDLSWLPASGMVILAMGLLECLDAVVAKETRDFLQNLQVGVLDAVVGGLILFSVAEAPERFSLMLATFLMVRGIVRVPLVYALGLPRAGLIFLGALSFIMGLMVWMGWPSKSGWFMSFCLNIEIAIRGWAMLIFALWVRKQKIEEFI